MTNFLDTGGKLPAGPPYREWVKKHQEILLKINRNPRHLNPIVKLWSFINETQQRVWFYSCRICPTSGWRLTWDRSYEDANHHARNHHRSKTWAITFHATTKSSQPPKTANT